MFESTFVETVEAALAYAVESALAQGVPPDWDGVEACGGQIRELCRDAALRLLDDLDGHLLLDLALMKLAAEQGGLKGEVRRDFRLPTPAPARSIT